MSSHSGVLVVGAGPTGLTLGVSLRRQGIPCRIIDQAPAPSEHSKALGVHARTLEIFHDLAVAQPLVALGWKVYGFNAYSAGERIVHVGMDELDTPYPYVLSVPQSDTERVLLARLEELGGRVERPLKLVSLTRDGEGLVAGLQTDDGAETSTRWRWVIGCDGAHSTVRRELGFSFEGTKYEEPFLLADVEIDWAYPRDEVHVFLSPDGVLVVIPMTRPHYRIVASFAGDHDAPAETFDTLEELVRQRGPQGMTISRPIWISGFRIHRRMAPSYRRGSVFLAGDAAHIHSPVGGQGLNMGVQDAYNLGWKLGLVIKGVARDELLNSYEVERLPIARTTLQGTDRATRMVTLRQPILQELRNYLAHLLSSLEVVQQRMTTTVAGLRLNYEDSPIVDEYRPSILSAHLFSSTERETPSLSDWFDFGAAPRAGDRAPNVSVGEDELLEILKGPHSTLLLFDGQAPTPEGYRNLAQIARFVDEGPLAPYLKTHIVVPSGSVPQQLASARSVLLDRTRALHHKYGAGSECLYLIRPDGYVGYRSQPAQIERLKAYLERLFG